MKEKLKLQDLLSFGYLFLLALGIMRDAIYYGFLGVNIINYSNILDVLLSPVAYMTESIAVPVIILCLILFIVWVSKAGPRMHKKYKNKAWYGKLINVEKTDKMYASDPSLTTVLTFSAVLIASFYLGSGVGAGVKTSDMVESKAYDMRETITFIDGDKEQVRILGQNSGYIFYIKKATSEVSITPINGIVKEIQTIAK